MIKNYPGWLAEMITQNRCGIAVEPDNPGAFADALDKMAADSALVTAMGLNARELAVSEFDRDKLGNRFVDFLENMAGR